MNIRVSKNNAGRNTGPQASDLELDVRRITAVMLDLNHIIQRGSETTANNTYEIAQRLDTLIEQNKQIIELLASKNFDPPVKPVNLQTLQGQNTPKRSKKRDKIRQWLEDNPNAVSLYNYREMADMIGGVSHTLVGQVINE